MDILSLLLLTAEAALAFWLLRREGLLKSNHALLVSALLLILSFGARAAVLDYETLDYKNFLSHWVEFFRENGGFLALKRQVGNYNIPYLYFLALFTYLPSRDLYLIKLMSVLFDVLLAWGAERLLGRFTDSSGRRLACFFTVLLWPTVFLNGSLWGQCDSTYVALALLGLVFALEDRPILSMVMMALSFGFKLQAVFLLPICAVLWMAGKYRWQHFLVFPATYVLLVLPAVIAGRPFLDTITLYFGQTGSIGSGLNYNSPSIFSVFTGIQDKELASTIGIIAAFVYMLNLLAAAFAKRHFLNDKAILALTLLFAVGIPFFLPHMHERYFFGGDILSLVLAFSFPAFSLTAVLCEFASLLGYHAYLKERYLNIGGHWILMNFGAAALILAMALALIAFLQALGPEQKGALDSPTKNA